MDSWVADLVLQTYSGREHDRKAIYEASDINLCFIDFSKTFYVVNHWIIYAKLVDLGISNHLVTWIRNVFADRTLQMQIVHALSNEALAPSGVLQGSIIGRLLFLVIINDLPGKLQLSCSMFVDTAKIWGKTTDVKIIQSNLLKTAEETVWFNTPHPVTTYNLGRSHPELALSKPGC